MAEDCYAIGLELPGVVASDIDVMVQDGSLTMHGEKRFEHEKAGRTYFFSEREDGAFQRSFRLPPDAAADRIDVACKKGVLNFRIPKRSQRRCQTAGRPQWESRQSQRQTVQSDALRQPLSVP
jgi:HSP20 family protein